MVSRSNGVDEARSLSESRLNSNSKYAGGYFSCRERCEETENLASLYDGETEQGLTGSSAKEKDMEFVRRTILSALVQDVVARVQRHLIYLNMIG
jgi:hypothetical protein